jgi:peptidoglycan/LPS O-acetylase OafA/YrhL
MTLGDFLRQCAFRLYDPARQLLVQDWSLGVELKGSALIPLFVFLLCLRKGVPWLLLLGAVFPFLTETGHYYSSFVIGAVLARYGAQAVQRLPPNRFTKGLLLLLGLVIYQAWGAITDVYPNQRMPGQIGWVATSLGCALILLAVFSSPSLQAWLNHKFMVFLGRVSYSVYLLQFIILLCLLPPLVRLGNLCGLSTGPGLFILTLLVSSAATIAAAAVTYRLIEVPAINLGHQLTQKLQKRFQK